jgi:hypothetical protein
MRCAREAWLLGFLGVRRDDAARRRSCRHGGAVCAARRVPPRRAELLLGYVPFVMVFVPYLALAARLLQPLGAEHLLRQVGHGLLRAAGGCATSGRSSRYWPLLLACCRSAGSWRRSPTRSSHDLAVRRPPAVGRARRVRAAMPRLRDLGRRRLHVRASCCPWCRRCCCAADFACQRWRPIGLQVAWAAVLALGFSFRSGPRGSIVTRTTSPTTARSRCRWSTRARHG